jgi:hypothetical protein
LPDDVNAKKKSALKGCLAHHFGSDRVEESLTFKMAFEVSALLITWWQHPTN